MSNILELYLDLFLVYTWVRGLGDCGTHWCMIPSMAIFERSSKDVESFIEQAIDRLDDQ